MRPGRFAGRWARSRPWIAPVVTGLAAGSVTVVPGPLLPIARAYRDLCERYQVLALLTHHVPPFPLALLLILAGLGLLNGGRAGITGLVGALRVNRRLRSRAQPLPPRLAHAGRSLGLDGWLTFLEEVRPAAFC